MPDQIRGRREAKENPVCATAAHKSESMVPVDPHPRIAGPVIMPNSRQVQSTLSKTPLQMCFRNMGRFTRPQMESIVLRWRLKEIIHFGKDKEI